MEKVKEMDSPILHLRVYYGVRRNSDYICCRFGSCCTLIRVPRPSCPFGFNRRHVCWRHPFQWRKLDPRRTGVMATHGSCGFLSEWRSNAKGLH